MAKVRVRLGWC